MKIQGVDVEDAFHRAFDLAFVPAMVACIVGVMISEMGIWAPLSWALWLKLFIIVEYPLTVAIMATAVVGVLVLIKRLLTLTA
jgi:uncharacterized protein (DUF983 family)